eukprot:739228-Pleurochrysis_carterae.AAC.1
MTRSGAHCTIARKAKVTHALHAQSKARTQVCMHEPPHPRTSHRMHNRTRDHARPHPCTCTPAHTQAQPRACSSCLSRTHASVRTRLRQPERAYEVSKLRFHLVGRDDARRHRRRAALAALSALAALRRRLHAHAHAHASVVRGRRTSIPIAEKAASAFARKRAAPDFARTRAASAFARKETESAFARKVLRSFSRARRTPLTLAVSHRPLGALEEAREESGLLRPRLDGGGRPGGGGAAGGRVGA